MLKATNTHKARSIYNNYCNKSVFFAGHTNIIYKLYTTMMAPGNEKPTGPTANQI
jgi:hypothetical protein